MSIACLQLEAALHKLDNVHESFRLWITAEPHPGFPIGLLQMGIKVTNEAPVGIKAGLRVSYQWITQVGCPGALTSVASLLSHQCLDAQRLLGTPFVSSTAPHHYVSLKLARALDISTRLSD